MLLLKRHTTKPASRQTSRFTSGSKTDTYVLLLLLYPPEHLSIAKGFLRISAGNSLLERPHLEHQLDTSKSSQMTNRTTLHLRDNLNSRELRKHRPKIETYDIVTTGCYVGQRSDSSTEVTRRMINKVIDSFVAFRFPNLLMASVGIGQAPT